MLLVEFNSIQVKTNTQIEDCYTPNNRKPKTRRSQCECWLNTVIPCSSLLSQRQYRNTTENN